VFLANVFRPRLAFGSLNLTRRATGLAPPVLRGFREDVSMIVGGLLGTVLILKTAVPRERAAP